MNDLRALCPTCGKPAHRNHYLGACGPVSSWPKWPKAVPNDLGHCSKCGGLIIEGFREVTGRDANLQDYSRVVRYCEECGEEVGDE